MTAALPLLPGAEILNCKSNNINRGCYECSVNHTQRTRAEITPWWYSWRCMCTAEHSAGCCEQSSQYCMTCLSPCCRPVYQSSASKELCEGWQVWAEASLSSTGNCGVRPFGLRTAFWIPLANMHPSNCLLAVTWMLAQFVYLQILIMLQMKSFNGRASCLKTAVSK